MSNLLSAGFRRYLRSPVLWGCILLSVFFGLYFGNLLYDARTPYLEATHFWVPQMVFAILISISVGREFGDGTIRNKIVAGHTKTNIFFSEVILAIGFCTALLILFVGTLFIFDISDFSKIPFDIGADVVIGLILSHVVFIMICLFISMALTSKQAIAAVLNLVLVLVLAFVSDEISLALSQREFLTEYSEAYDEESENVEIFYLGERKNPNYVGGVKRDMYELILDILPSGQIAEYCDIVNECFSSDGAGLLEEEPQTTLHAHSFYSVGTFTVLLAAGVFLFRRRDLK